MGSLHLHRLSFISHVCRCRTDVARVERISCEQGLFISPATLQGFKSKSCIAGFPTLRKRCATPVTAPVMASSCLKACQSCIAYYQSCWCHQLLCSLQAANCPCIIFTVMLRWVYLLQPSRSLLIMLDTSGATLQHIQHSLH